MSEEKNVNWAIKKTEYKYFGNYELSPSQEEAVNILVEHAKNSITVESDLRAKLRAAEQENKRLNQWSERMTKERNDEEKLKVKYASEADDLEQERDELRRQVEMLTKAVEWMKSTGDYFRYKAPEQIDATKLVAAMYETADDALTATAGTSYIKRLEQAARELLEVAELRGDNSLPNPADDAKQWTARMQTAWDNLAAVLAEREGKHERD